MNVTHVDFMGSRRAVDKPLDYAIDWRTGTFTVVDSWDLVRKAWDSVQARLTMGQYQKCTGSLSYKMMFQKALKYSRKAFVQRQCTEALAMIDRLEASKAQANG